MQKIAIIGNSGGGKTELARQISKNLNIPVTHIDSIQFVAGMRIRPHQDSIAQIRSVQAQVSWIIDGYGPLDILQERLDQADLIIFVDFPIWRHYWWCTKRQIKNIWSPRQELPKDCNELTWAHTKKLFKNLWQVHSKMRPELIRILKTKKLVSKVKWIRTLQDYRSARMP